MWYYLYQDIQISSQDHIHSTVSVLSSLWDRMATGFECHGIWQGPGWEQDCACLAVISENLIPEPWRTSGWLNVLGIIACMAWLDFPPLRQWRGEGRGDGEGEGEGPGSCALTGPPPVLFRDAVGIGMYVDDGMITDHFRISGYGAMDLCNSISCLK